MIPQIINHFTDDDLYKFTMCCAVIDNYPRACVKYTFTDRSNRVYPKGFKEEFDRQVACLENLKITEDEVEFMKRRCPYVPHWFYNYLRGFTFHREWVTSSMDEEGHFHLSIEGLWSETILLEVKLLAIISELYFIMTGESALINLEEARAKTLEKGRRLLDAGCVFSDFGTRRRASFDAQDAVVSALKDCGGIYSSAPGKFVGTSNVYLAMKHDLVPTGTMAHEIVCGLAGMYGPQMSNYLAMKMWSETYRGALGTFLYDTYGWNIFSLNFSEGYANLFKGLRVDSGDNYEQLDKIVAKYRSLGIDPATKQVVFSNALDTDRVIAIQDYARDKCLPSFGIGTHFTCDFDGLEPMNIVIKLTAIKITELWDYYNETCKLSEDKGKNTGNTAVVRRFREALHIHI